MSNLLPTQKLTITGLRSITQEQYARTKSRRLRREFIDLFNNAEFYGVNNDFDIPGELMIASLFAVKGMARQSGLSFELLGRIPPPFNDGEPGVLLWRCLKHKGCRVEGGVG